MNTCAPDYLSELLVCPQCHSKLICQNTGLKCGSCDSRAKIVDGVIKFDAPYETSDHSRLFYNDAEHYQGQQKLEELHRLHYGGDSLSGKIERYFKNELMKLVVNGERPFIDIGCGTGLAFNHFGYPKPIIGIDIDFNLMKICKGNFPESQCICCDINRAPFSKNSLKTIFSLYTLEHVFYLESFMGAVADLLSPYGYFYAAIPTEGGFVWSCLRRLAHIKYAKKLNINYKKIVAEKEHCNKASTIDNVINKFFIIDARRAIPFRAGGINFNMSLLYRLKKRT
jgi:SAM-dependent methyltransferase